MTIFERILDQGTVESAVRDTLQNWMPTYLAELERQTGRNAGDLPQPRSWTRKNQIDAWPEDQLPLVVIVCSGLAGTPQKIGTGRYRAPWGIGIAVVVSAKDEKSTRDLAGVYGAAVRAVLLQHQGLDGFPGAMGVVWQDERTGELPNSGDEARTVAAIREVFSIEFDDVTTVGAGPLEPDISPQPDWPEITGVQINITKEATNA